MEIVPMVMLFLVLVAREAVHYFELRDERQRNAADRTMLLQRIQAPKEVAYREFAETLPPGAPSEPIWSDEEAWQALGGLPAKASELVVDDDEISDWERLMRASE